MIELRIPRPLESPNRNRGAHWATRHRESAEWESEISVAIALLRVPIATWSLVIRTEPYVSKAGAWKVRQVRRRERRRVVVARHVQSAARFISDHDNLAFSTKPVLDALKRLAIIFDDSIAWLDKPPTTQHVTDDGSEFTVIRIERIKP